MVKRKKTYDEELLDYNRKRAGKAAQGFVLGGLAGNIPGALFGGWYAQKDMKAPKRIKLDNPSGQVVPKKTMPKKNVQNKLVNRSAMVVRGKAKVKNVKKLKVSKYLKKAIKQVTSGSAARGTYTTLKQGYVGSCAAIGTGVLSFSCLGEGSGVAANQTVALFADPAVTPVGFRTLWNCLAQNNLTLAPNVVTQGDLNFFTPAKILDAASVLFNGKAPGNPQVTTGNLSEVVSNTTGAPTTTTPNLKIEVVNSSAVFRIKNTSDRVVLMDIWECTPTLKFQPNNIVQTLATQFNAFQNGGLDETVEYHKTSAGSISGEYLFEGSYDPLAVSKQYQGLPFKWKKREMVLHPDETCVHTIKGPRGTLDFKKLVTSTPASTSSQIQLNPLVKGWSVSCAISIRGDQVFKPAVAGIGGRDVYHQSVVAGTVSFGMPVSIELEEKYRLVVPDIAGYRTQNGAAGTVQSLNFRKPRFIFWNTLPVQSVTVPAAQGYVVSSEENFVADTVAGRQNQ